MNIWKKLFFFAVIDLLNVEQQYANSVLRFELDGFILLRIKSVS